MCVSLLCALTFLALLGLMQKESHRKYMEVMRTSIAWIYTLFSADTEMFPLPFHNVYPSILWKHNVSSIYNLASPTYRNERPWLEVSRIRI